MDGVTKKDLVQWSRLGPRPMFGQFMLRLGAVNDDLMVVSADLGRSSGLDRFKKQFPEKYLSVGISEQNMVGVAAGLAKEGFKVFVTSFAPFLSMRASEQIRMNLGYMELGVNLVALGGGLSMGYLGNSHFGLEDIAVMRTVPNLNIHCPSDSFELWHILNDISSNNRGPSYIRLTGAPGMPPVHNEKYNYKFNCLNQLRNGQDVLVIASGSMVSQSQIAIEKLNENGIEAALINLHTIKPLPSNLMETFEQFDRIVLVEEHTAIGGLLGAISEQMVVEGITKKVLAINLPDQFGPTGTYNYLLDYHGLTGEKIAKRIEKFMKNQ
jgi:transketolase